MRSLSITFDPACEDCQKAWRRIKRWQRKRADCYGSVIRKTGNFVKGVLIRPDYNASGHLTHWHIESEA